MQVHRENITVPQGTTYRQKLYYVFPNGDPIPLHDFTACMQIREYVDAAEVLYQSEYGGDIVIEAEAGAIYLRIPSNKTEQWDWLRGVYDIELISPTGQTTRIMEGRVRVTANVTRDCREPAHGPEDIWGRR